MKNDIFILYIWVNSERKRIKKRPEEKSDTTHQRGQFVENLSEKMHRESGALAGIVAVDFLTKYQEQILM